MSRVLKIDTTGLSPAQKETAAMLKKELSYGSVTKLEIWPEKDFPGEMGVEVIDDGMPMIGFFNEQGELIGDWR